MQSLRDILGKPLRYYSRLPHAFRVYILPPAIGFISLSILIFRPSLSGVFQYLLISAWLFFSVLNAYLIDKNSGYSKKVVNRLLTLESVQNSSIVYLDSGINIIADRIQKIKINPNFSEDHRRNFLTYLEIINSALHMNIESYLMRAGRLNGSKITLSMVYPNKSGDCLLLGDVQRSIGSTRLIPRETGLNIRNDKTLGARLWADKRTYIMSISNTKKASKAEKFSFLSSNEELNLRSIIGFKVINPITAKPVAMWFAESDKNDVFPDDGEIDITNDISEIFSIYEKYFNTEYLFYILQTRLGRTQS